MTSAGLAELCLTWLPYSSRLTQAASHGCLGRVPKGKANAGKASWGLGSELAHCPFCCILSAKESNKAFPDARGGGIRLRFSMNGNGKSHRKRCGYGAEWRSWLSLQLHRTSSGEFGVHPSLPYLYDYVNTKIHFFLSVLYVFKWMTSYILKNLCNGNVRFIKNKTLL